jgi:hypothetical protein
VVVNAQIDLQNTVLAAKVARFRYYGTRYLAAARIAFRTLCVYGLRESE